MIHRHTDFNRVTTHLAIFNVMLLFNGGIQQYFDGFAAVRAMYIAGYKSIHGLSRLPQGYVLCCRGISPVASQWAHCGSRLSAAQRSYLPTSSGLSTSRQRPFVPL